MRAMLSKPKPAAAPWPLAVINAELKAVEAVEAEIAVLLGEVTA